MLYVSLAVVLVNFMMFWAASRFKKRTNSRAGCQKSISTDNHIKLLQKSSLEERAAPNQRLVRVFEIDNAFTTTDKDYHKKFVTDARLKLATSGDEWKPLVGTIEKYIKGYLDESENKPNPMNLATLVQAIAFRAVMLKFFPKAPTASDQVVQSITSQINSLWIASKDGAYLESDFLVVDRVKLTLDLRNVFGDHDNEGFGSRENPLNIILPAYETLWRIVLRLFLEVRFRSTEVERRKYVCLFKTFIPQPNQLLDRPQHPCDEAENAFELAHSAQYLGGVSVKDIVNEGLRLYPPTRRIYRQVNERRFAVDVEAIHRDPTFWGSDALVFRPRRFVGAKTLRASNFLPFGSGVFECPAKSSFGPIMIGVIVAALTTNIGEEYQLVGNEIGVVISGKGPLGNGRDALEDLWIALNVSV